METLTALGDLISKVKMVALDPSKLIIQDFVRVQVLFNVVNPLQMSKAMNLLSG